MWSTAADPLRVVGTLAFVRAGTGTPCCGSGFCRLSLEPESCLHQTENAFRKSGMPSLLVSTFVPGLNAGTAPLAGNAPSSSLRFAVYEGSGTLLSSGACIALGHRESQQRESLVGAAARMGSSISGPYGKECRRMASAPGPDQAFRCAEREPAGGLAGRSARNTNPPAADAAFPPPSR